ncbi:glycoside hydrolase family protein [Bythopirellula polymerisocia]|uniref:Glycosyl hydrolase catalytic core n=1 Tax=Bythopirellula polymerisocia TaxID=2528003 RepID=A0A5C6CG72_9BACT|nr:glycoside hydrolase family protein [Bythopirellula polymerisocia]TWU22717.1 Glycosyl hydrolase catalytic core [Bythopirellula polymerisocia]
MFSTVRLLLALCSLHFGLATSPGEAKDTTAQPSAKRGFCTVVRKDGEGAERIEALNAKWFYTWGAKKPAVMPQNAEFVPMIWGRFNPERHSHLEQLTLAAQQGEFKYLMGFNEPDQPKQSDITVSEAIQLWPVLEAIGLPLCSPGCVHPDKEWMQQFMKEVDELGLRVDYVSVHSYGGPSAKALVERLKKIHAMYNRPIWITEFAVGDWNAQSVAENKHSPEKIKQFMLEVLPMLEELDFVHRYAWFSASPDSAPLGTSALFNEDGSLTELGEIYSSF